MEAAVAQNTSADAEEVLWGEIIDALTTNPTLHEAAFAQLQGSLEPFKQAIAIRAALPPSLRQRSQQTLRTWASREAACLVSRQELKEKLAATEEKAKKEHDLALLAAVSPEPQAHAPAKKRSRTSGAAENTGKRRAVTDRGAKKTAKGGSGSKSSDDLEQIPGEIKRCEYIGGCNRNADGMTKGLCYVHGGQRKCKYADGCEKRSKAGGFCIAHGGGRRCAFAGGCDKSAQRTGLCKNHGGGKKCEFSGGCEKFAFRRGLCNPHGGGDRCDFEGCRKFVQRNGLCRLHGGGKTCEFEGGCEAPSVRNGVCDEHGASNKCGFEGCKWYAKRMGMCVAHGREEKEV